MSRIRTAIQDAARRGEKAMGIFITNGFPDPESTLPILEEIDQAGADFIELGMAFSDPLAEGIPIQRSSERALRHGMTLKDVLVTAEQFRARSDTPLLLMGYINPIFRYGTGNFCRAARSSGVDGLILPDLPPEEGAAFEEEVRAASLEVVHLIAPNTADDRIRQIDQRASGFVYAVSITGLTGSDVGASRATEAYLQRARSIVTRNPLLVGFGIRSHDTAMQLSQYTDGFIVGSALVELVEHLWDDPALSMAERLAQVRAFVASLKFGEKSNTTTEVSLRG